MWRQKGLKQTWQIFHLVYLQKQLFFIDSEFLYWFYQRDTHTHTHNYHTVSLHFLIRSHTHTDIWTESVSEVLPWEVCVGTKKRGETERERGMKAKGSDRNYYSNSPCRCLQICSPSLLFYLRARSSPLRLPVCLQCSLPMSFSFALPLATAPAYLYYLLFLSSTCLSFPSEG